RFVLFWKRPPTTRRENPTRKQGTWKEGAATMKAFEIKGGFGLDALTLVERPDPRPGYGQVKLKMRAWSLNYRDLLIVKGLYNPKLRLPLIPLSDGVGEVIAVGDGVSGVKVGERVAGLFMQNWLDGPATEAKTKPSLGGGGADGLLAEYAVLNQDGVVHVSE